MKYSAVLLGLVAALPAVQGIAFGGPSPTDTSPERAQNGVSPIPTKGPSVSELKRRQTNLFPETCGWVDGDYSSAVTCNLGRTCMLYTSASFGMAGCCDGRDTQECGWSHQCIDLSDFSAGKCGSDCLRNSFVRKCTDALAPFCVTWSYPSDGILDYGCADTSTNRVYVVSQRGTDGVGDTTVMTLPTVSGNAVTGFQSDSKTTTGLAGGSGGTSGDTTSTRTAKKVAIGVIVGIAVAVLFVLFVIIVGVVMFLKKRKKQRLLAANAQAMANAQVQKPQQPMYPPQQQQSMVGGFVPQPLPQQNGFVPPQPPQSPQPTLNGYFPPPGQHDPKYNAHTSIHEYAMTPISSPPTPAPAYSQPYVSPLVPPMPLYNNNSNIQPHYHSPADGAHEADSTGVSRPPAQQVASPVAQYQSPVGGAHEVDAISAPRPQNSGPVYEMGQGR